MSISLEDLDRMPLVERQKLANKFLGFFGQFTKYKHDKDNPYLQWLDKKIDDRRTRESYLDCHERSMLSEEISPSEVVAFMNFWYPVSRHQPQILLRCASALSGLEEHRRIVLGNYMEEIGFTQKGYDPHYILLERLMKKIGGEAGGRLNVSEKAERMVSNYHLIIDLTATNPARATGMLAAIEHPALDISGYFHKLITLAGRHDLLKTDPYLLIHVDVEPNHIILSHGAAEDYMHRSAAEKSEALQGFQKTMEFWEEFWPEAFKTVGYPSR